MLHSVVLLFIQALYTSCNKLSTFRSNMHPERQESTAPIDGSPYGSSTFPLSIAPWWDLLKKKGLFDRNDPSLYGTEIIRIHACLATFANEHFSCTNHGVHGYYMLVKALKPALENKTYFNFPLQGRLLVVSLIEVLKKQFSSSHTSQKYKLEEITRLQKQPQLDCEKCSFNLAINRYCMLKLSIPTKFVNGVHLKMLTQIVDEVNYFNDPNRIIDHLGLDHMINLMRMLASYPSSSIQNIHFNKCIRSIVNQLNVELFSCHRVTTWLEISKLLKPNQQIDPSNPNNPQGNTAKYFRQFITWACDQNNTVLFTSTPKSAWDALTDTCLHFSYKQHFRLSRTNITLLINKIYDYYNTDKPSDVCIP